MCTMARDVVVRSALCLLDDTRTCLLSQIYTYFQDLLLEGMSLQIYTYFQAARILMLSSLLVSWPTPLRPIPPL